MLNRNAMAGAVISFLLTAAAFAAQPLQVKPWVYDPDHSGICTAAWVSKAGLPDGTGNANSALVLTKFGPTNTNAASGASINFQGTLTELGFDVRDDGWCGAGAPRFNVYTQNGTYYFLGCIYGDHSEDTPKAGWTRVRFYVEDFVLGVNVFASSGAGDLADFQHVVGIDIVFDEGTDIEGNPGFTVLDNIDINGTLIGKPGAGK